MAKIRILAWQPEVYLELHLYWLLTIYIFPNIFYTYASINWLISAVVCHWWFVWLTIRNMHIGLTLYHQIHHSLVCLATLHLSTALINVQVPSITFFWRKQLHMGQWGMVDASCGPKLGSGNCYDPLGVKIFWSCDGNWMGMLL